MTRWTLLAALTLAFGPAACDRPQEQEQPVDVAVAPSAGVDRSHAGAPAPDVAFLDPDGEEMTLADFRGVPVLVNLWATWCAPCKKELPTLDALAKRNVADGELGVIAVSQDIGPQASVQAALDDIGVPDLAAYHDPKMALSGALNVQVMPTTVLYDASGREVWRYIGDLDWSGQEAAKLLAEASNGEAR